MKSPKGIRCQQSAQQASVDEDETDCAKEFRAKYELDLGKKEQDNEKDDKREMEVFGHYFCWALAADC